MLNWLVPIVAVALLLVCIVGPIVLMRRHHAKREALVQLRAPLLNSDDHRVDAALREAESGFNQCRACGFDNFKRAAFCAICGDEIRDASVAVATSSTSKLLFKRTKSKTTSTLTTTANNHPTDHTTQSNNSTNAASLLDARVRRQRRARKRKEWQRRFDVKGAVFWYRSSGTRCDGYSSVDPSTKLRFPGYVLEMQPRSGGNASTIINLPPIPDLDNDTASSVVDIVEEKSDFGSLISSVSEYESNVTLEEPRTMIERTLTLEAAVQSVQFDLVDTSSAFAGRLPTVESSLDDAQILEVISLFRRDFPSKYAHFVACTAGLIVPAEIAHLRLNVNRKLVYEDSVASFAVIHRGHMRSVMRINFVEENGVDAGGVHREWFALFVEKIVDPATGLLVCVDRTEQTYYLNPHSKKILGDDHLTHFFALGRLLGRALLEGYATGFHFALPLLKIILGVPVSFSDLEFFDPETYKNMLWMLESSGVEDLGLDFSVTETVSGASADVVVTDLIPNGRNIPVSDLNKMLFLERKFKHMVFKSIEGQLFALLKGLYEVIPQQLLMMFDPEELDYVLCGSDEINVDDWEANAKYTPDLHDHPALRWFWELVREMPNEYRRRLLLFSTGSSRVPLAGFSALTSYDGRLCPFTLNGVNLVNEGYIIGHACFNRIDLPRHVVREELKAVLYATLNTDQYGFTTD